MGPLSWLFRAVGRLFGSIGSALGFGGKPQGKPADTRIQPLPAKAKPDDTTPEEMRYAGWREVDSSWIEYLNYNPLVPFAQMIVRRTKKIYTFGGMTLEKYKAWVNSSSKGTFFNRELKGKYTRWAGFPEIKPPDVYAFSSGTGGVPVSRR